MLHHRDYCLAKQSSLTKTNVPNQPFPKYQARYAREKIAASCTPIALRCMSRVYAESSFQVQTFGSHCYATLGGLNQPENCYDKEGFSTTIIKEYTCLAGSVIFSAFGFGVSLVHGHVMT